MIGRTSGVKSVLGAARQFSVKAALLQESHPSTPDMKSRTKWINSDHIGNKESRETSAIFKVVQTAKDIQKGSVEAPVNVHRMFKPKASLGDFNSPYDFSMTKILLKPRFSANSSNDSSRDPFEKAGIDPIDIYTMPELLSRFLSSTGQILPRSVTGCNDSNQKKLGIAVHRARQIGLLSTVHRHARYMPERYLGGVDNRRH